MEFASKFGYNYGHSGSDSEEISDEEIETKQKVKRRIRKVDSNVISVKFDQLLLPNEMFAGEPIVCKRCNAIMSSMSKSSVKTDDATSARTWECEFCYEKNDVTKLVSSGLDEIPKEADVTFLVEQAPAKVVPTTEASAAGSVGAPSEDDSYLSFCMDVSGSMDTQIQVKRANNQEQLTDTNMSRLQGVKSACLENIEHLKTTEPNKRVSLTTFSNEIKFYGDGTKCRNNAPLTTIQDGGRQSNSSMRQAYMGNRFPLQQQQQSPAENEAEMPTDIMNNKEKLIAMAQNQDGDLKGIKDTHANLGQRIKQLRTEGSTALGPGLVFSIGFSAKKRGSQVILCTDGAANVGMGSVEHGDPLVAEKFYEDLASQAKSLGVTVNVISMEGTDCKLALLGKVADLSNGTMNIVNPANLSEQFRSILENRIVATNVKARLIVNKKYLYIRDEELEAAEGKAIEKNDMAAKEALNAQKKSIVEKDIGNANIDTEITFEYGVRKLSSSDTTNNNSTASAAKADSSATSSKKSTMFDELPFQLQISYTTMDGAKAMRVYTKVQKFTNERQVAEQNLLSNELLWANAAQKMSYHVCSNNIGVAKYRQQQMHQQQLSNHWAAPQMYSAKAAMVSNFRKSMKMEDMGDHEAEEMYSGKKNVTK